MRKIGRKIKIELLSEEGDIVEIFFSYKRTQKVARLLLNELKTNNGLTRVEFSKFAWELDKGNLKQAPGFKYSRGQFYARIRRTLLVWGLLGIAERPMKLEWGLIPNCHRHRDIIEKYVPILQPITKRPPDGINLPRLTWIICRKWNDEFKESNDE